MPKPIRTLIVDNVVAVLGGISVANGYATTVARAFDRFVDPDTMPGTWVMVGVVDDETYGELSNPKLERTLPLKIVGIVACQPDAGDGIRTEAEKLLADIEKSLLADRTRGGRAIDTQLVRNHVFDADSGAPYAEVHVDVRCKYRTNRGDPFTAA